jgi:hypothetical protein
MKWPVKKTAHRLKRGTPFGADAHRAVRVELLAYATLFAVAAAWPLDPRSGARPEVSGGRACRWGRHADRSSENGIRTLLQGRQTSFAVGASHRPRGPPWRATPAPSMRSGAPASRPARAPVEKRSPEDHQTGGHGVNQRMSNGFPGSLHISGTASCGFSLAATSAVAWAGRTRGPTPICLSNRRRSLARQKH